MADLWGQGWTTGSLSNATFRLEIQPDGPTVTGEHWKLDSVHVSVYYTVVTAFEGLSHGYWKNHTDDWTDYTPSDTLEGVFDIPDSFGLDDNTLLEALEFTGSGDPARILLIQAVAALLNAADLDIDYPLTVAEIIEDVNTALAGSASDMETLKDLLDGYNNLGLVP